MLRVSSFIPTVLPGSNTFSLYIILGAMYNACPQRLQHLLVIFVGPILICLLVLEWLLVGVLGRATQLVIDRLGALQQSEDEWMGRVLHLQGIIDGAWGRRSAE